MTMKASDRRVILRRAQTLMNQLIAINEQASVTAATLIAAGTADPGDTADLILAAGGPDGAGTDTLTDEIIEILDGTVGSIDWTYLAE